MQVTAANGVLCLAHGALLRLDGAAGHRLVSVRGVLLVSQEGSPVDCELRAGETLTVGNNGCVLVEAWGEAALRLEARPRTCAWWRRGAC